MSRCQQVARPLALCLRPRGALQIAGPSTSTAAVRLFANSASRCDVEPTTDSSLSSTADAQATADVVHAKASSTSSPNSEVEGGKAPGLRAQWLDPNTTTLKWAEKKLLKRGIDPIGSRRRRAAEARKLLAEDRAEKLEEIKKAYAKLKKAEAQPADKYRGGEPYKQKRLHSLREHLEWLKVQADINDPAVKRKFEDGFGDLSKPIYRYLAEQRWRGMAYKILAQRVEQFHIVPDVLPKFDPKMDLQLSWHRYRIQPGEIVNSLVSESPPNLRVQVFDSRQRLVTIVVMDSDVPNSEDDSFGRRLHYLAANIPLDCLTKNISLNLLASKHQDKIAVPWMPPFSQEGSPYHRLSVWILEQKDNKPLDISELQTRYATKRDGFSLVRFRSDQRVDPFGFNLFRSVWDSNTAAVMARHEIPGAEIIFRRKRVYSLKPPKKARGWEAKRQGPKYRQLWKYSKRIASMSGGT